MSAPVTMSAEQVLAELGELASLPDISPTWDEAQKLFPAAAWEFLQPQTIRERMAYCGFEAPAVQAAISAAAGIVGRPALARLAWYMTWRVFHGSAKDTYLKNWPGLEGSLGELAGCFYLICALEAVPGVRTWHKLLGVPEDVARQTCRVIFGMAENYRRSRGGRCGVFARQWPWLRNYIGKNLYFRLGRLEYWAEAFSGAVEAWRDRRTGSVVALARDNTRFDGRGRVVRGETKAPDEWTATLTKSGETVSGYLITPQGQILRKQVELRLDRWAPVLNAGDAVLSVHIPAGGNMTIDACRESLNLAADFFARHFPYIRPTAVCSGSWIFHPGLERILPADSNVLRLQRELYLFPVPTGPQDGTWFVFYQDKFDPAAAPRDTSLQRTILDRLAAGEEWPGSGGMFFLLEDLPNFGKEFYRSNHSGIFNADL